MPLDRLIEQHKKQVRAARSSEVIFDVTLDAIRELGFNRLAIVHALWFTQPGRRLLFLHNFDEWGDIFVTRQYFRHDPALIASQRTNRPFTRSEEHTSELQSLMRISYAVFCLNKKNTHKIRS